jgi:hypothetical protein
MSVFLPSHCVVFAFGWFPNAPASGLGQLLSIPREAPPPIALMWRANVGRSETPILRIEPELGQCAENGIESSSSSDGCDVFQKQVAGSYVANDPYELEVEAAALGVDAGSFACKAEILTGKPSDHQIDTASESAAWECADVRPDRRRVQAAVFHARDEHGCGVGFPLHKTQTADAGEDALDGEVEGADS